MRQHLNIFIIPLPIAIIKLFLNFAGMFNA